MDAVQHEIMGEKAGALQRTERRFLDALEAYREQEAAAGSHNAASREGALWDLVEAVTWFVVQREAIGMRDARQLLEFYEVPPEIVRRVGVRRTAAV